MAVVMAALPNARGNGLSAMRPGGRAGGCRWSALLLAAGDRAVCLGRLDGAVRAGRCGAAGAPPLLALAARARIGGQTGDILGASAATGRGCRLAVLSAQREVA